MPKANKTESAEMEDDIGYVTLTGSNPYFDIILRKVHLGPAFQVYIPTRITDDLASLKAPVVLLSHGNRWNTTSSGGNGKRFGWRKFVIDNDLKVGDCCFFELLEASNTEIEFKVIILRGLPSHRGENNGDSHEESIVIE
ncbi:OLC1v1030873C1 [Oldenlandia corymbosa var. corymbosa]|uniref:OLC1v1030873C1 n=1 Tax=Oldenlandia corymbosa var. corymbosa TaxID=529605 RepID=A0AAV1CH18_OLDCO|nr:OLC1v1030873C1 [Oldenlandia corymbosa var. corymbosa]